MLNASSKSKTYFERWERPWGPFAAVGVGFFGMIAVQIALAILLELALPLTGLKLDEESTTTSALFYGVTGVGQALFLWWFLRSRQAAFRTLGLANKSSWWRTICLVVGGFLGYFLLSVGVQAVLSRLIPAIDFEQAQDLGFAVRNSLAGYVLIFTSLVLLAPMVEEAIFRGFLFAGLRTKLSFPWAALISSACFGLAHFQLNIGLDTAVLGLVSCWLYEKSDSLWPSVGLHACKNLIAFVLVFILQAA